MADSSPINVQPRDKLLWIGIRACSNSGKPVPCKVVWIGDDGTYAFVEYTSWGTPAWATVEWYELARPGPLGTYIPLAQPPRKPTMPRKPAAEVEPEPEIDTEELYKRYRPTRFNEVIGQDAAVSMLADMVKRKAVPHTLLFAGTSGNGKTTLARILRRKIGCSDMDYVELNAAKARGIDTVRDIERKMGMSPMKGRCRVWCIDEAHALTNDAQNAFLKILEDTPRHVYFFLCTTDPGKLIKTIRTRATTIPIAPMSDVTIRELCYTVAEAEGVELTQDVCDKISDNADGSARQALVILDAVLHLDGEDAQIEAIQRVNLEKPTTTIAEVLFRKGAKWGDVANVLRTTESLKTEAESLRRGVLGYASAIMLRNNGALTPRAAHIIDCFQDNLYDSGAPGFVLAAYRAMGGKEG